MKKLYLLILIAISVYSSAEAQFHYTVRLKYKNSSYSLSQPSAFLSAKAIERRQKQHLLIDSTDLPVNVDYINTIANIPGVVVLNSSKWLNGLLVEINESNLINTITALPFVFQTTAVAVSTPHHNVPNIASANTSSKLSSPLICEGVTGDTLDYGGNYPQVHIHEGEYLHNLGFRGQGMTIAVLDGGFFAYKSNPAFDSLRNNNQVLGEYDFVNKETSVNEDNVHGSNCLSIMAANRPGFIVGTAPKASYWLFRTEDVSSEKPIEEYNWISGAERADSAGADMISSSLGYAEFDDPQYNHSYAQRNGNTALISIAADLAAKKGMIVMNSAGNSGSAADDAKYVVCPADGDSVVAVGAVNGSGVIGPFSSWGPNSAGKVKPNIVSVGWGAVYANTSGDPATGHGTSYSNPNIAGLIACLWQAFNEFTNMEIIDAVQKSADKYNNPDDRYGYGLPNFRIAFTILEKQREERKNNILQGKWITAFPVPFKQFFTVFVKAPSTGNVNLKLLDMTGRVVLEKNLQVQQGNYYNIKMNPSATQRFGIYYLQYNDGKNTKTLKLVGL